MVKSSSVASAVDYHNIIVILNYSSCFSDWSIWANVFDCRVWAFSYFACTVNFATQQLFHTFWLIELPNKRSIIADDWKEFRICRFHQFESFAYRGIFGQGCCSLQKLLLKFMSKIRRINLTWLTLRWETGVWYHLAFCSGTGAGNRSRSHIHSSIKCFVI